MGISGWEVFMRLKKAMAVIMTAVMSLCVFVAPASKLQTEAAPDWSQNWNDVRTYTANYSKTFPGVSIQTPQTTVKMYAGISWEQLELDVGVRLNVSDSECGAQARDIFNNTAASVGGYVVGILDMDMEFYTEGGWTQDVVGMVSPIRVGIALPGGSNPALDYAVISVKQDGGLEILGDIDPNPTTLTVDSSNFDTFAVIAAPAGTFDAFRNVSPYALEQRWVSTYAKDIGSTVSAESKGYQMYDIGTITDAATVRAAVGDQIVSLEVAAAEPGPYSAGPLRYAAWQAGARGSACYEIELRNGRRDRITQTNQKILVTMTVPFNFPACADYAVAVLNADGTVSILKDIDTNDSTVTIATDQFRCYAVMWGSKGAFALLP